MVPVLISVAILVLLYAYALHEAVAPRSFAEMWVDYWEFTSHQRHMAAIEDLMPDIETMLTANVNKQDKMEVLFTYTNGNRGDFLRIGSQMHVSDANLFAFYTIIKNRRQRLKIIGAA